MSENKRYYWIKLRENFLSSDAVDFLMSQKNGADYVVLYQMLCLKTANTGGELARQIGEIIIPYDAEKIQRDCKFFNIDTVRVALELYKKLGLVYEQDNGLLRIADFTRIVGSETKWAEYKRNKALEKFQSDSKNIPIDFQQDIDIKISRYKDINTKNNISNDIFPEAINRSAETEPEFIKLSLISGEDYPVSLSTLKQLEGLYPAVDVEQQLRNMAGWLLANPKNRKTKSGIMRFVTGWLSKEQNKARPPEKSYSKPTNLYTEEERANVIIRPGEMEDFIL